MIEASRHTNRHFAHAHDQLLAAHGITDADLDRVLNAAMAPSVDFADVYFQLSRQESWALEDQIVRSGAHSIDQGVGIRALSGEKTGFAYAGVLALPDMLKAAKAASAIASSGAEASLAIPTDRWAGTGHELYPVIDPVDSLNNEDKIAWLKRIDAHIRAQSQHVVDVSVSLSGVLDVCCVVRSDGLLVGDTRPLTRLNVQVILEKNGRREQGYAGMGGRFGYDKLLDDVKALALADEALRQALVQLEAIDAPAGTMPVVLASGWPGVLLHEAVGHGLEGDFNRKGTSTYAGRIGEQVASPLCTIVDDGTLPERRGSLNVDDEGHPTQYNVLIENGVLRGYMQDGLNAKLMGQPTTGNGRRESYAHLPMPRMTNTYMLAGESDPQDIIASVDKGLYAVNFSGGQVDITSGQFTFSTSEAYLIENGKITAPVKGATLIGNGPATMQQVSMVGNDMALDRGVGVCGKAGQSVPVGIGQPTLKIDAMTVGGTQS